MGISDEERREVAERMRVYSHDFDFDDSNPFWYVSKAAFGDVDVHTYYRVFARLADLIDRPTCYVVEHKTHCGSYGCEEAGTLWVLSCGDECVNDSDFPPRYCPDCGAMVTEEESRNVRKL